MTEPRPFAIRASIRAQSPHYRETQTQNLASQDGKVYGENRIGASRSTRCEEAQPAHVGHACSTTGSCGGKGNTDKIRASFTVFETVRYDSKRKSLNFCL